MQLSDYIQIAGIISSLIISIVSITIAIKTLKQNRALLQTNNKMLEDTFRPYVIVYGTTTNFGNARYYIILKNTGQSGTYITEFKSDYDLSLASPYPDSIKESFQKPFGNIVSSFIAPNQSIPVVIDLDKAVRGYYNVKGVDSINFQLKYIWKEHSYSETITLNLKAHYLLGTVRDDSPNKAKTIAYTLQDLVEKQL